MRFQDLSIQVKIVLASAAERGSQIEAAGNSLTSIAEAETVS